MNRFGSRRASSAGFTLVEALVALVVMAFGMLALAGFQASVSNASDTAKQRAEAVRLAQQKIEELRAFQQTASDGAGTIWNYADDVVSSAAPEDISKASLDVYNTANAYTRQWWVTTADGATAAGTTDAQKWIRVAVSWVDRKNQTQTVTLQSVIARSDPADLGTIGVGPGEVVARTPKNRSVDIPYPATSLAGGKSSIRPPGSSVTYVFDNTSGDVLGYCTQVLNTGDSVNLDSSLGAVTTGCTAQKSYLLSGYVRFLNSVPTNGNEKIFDEAVSNPTDATKEMTVSLVASSFTSGQSAQCYAQRQKVVSTNNTVSSNINQIGRLIADVVTVTTSGPHGMSTGQFVSINDTTNPAFAGLFTITKLTNTSFSYSQTGAVTGLTSSTGTATLIQQITIAESDTTPTGYNTEVSRFVAYSCVVVPYDHDGDEGTATSPTARRWWGQFVITPVLTSPDAAVWTLGTGSGDRQVCRFTGDYVIDDKMSNTEHPLHYRGVTGALDNQNYLVIPGNDTCPTNGKVDTANSNYINVHTILHQTASGSAAGGAASTTNAQWSTTPEPSAAPTGITDLLPMFF